MIDFVKIRIKGEQLHERLLHGSQLNFTRGRNRYTSDKFRDLVFTLHDSENVEIAGSLHKYWNHGLHNWNDFARVDLWDTIHDVCQWLQIDPSEAELHNLEFGVNIVVPFSPRDFLGDLLTFKDKTFGKVCIKEGTYHQAATFDYYVKCYDKGAQYSREENILRFEVKVRSMRYLHGVGVNSLEDLMTASKLAALDELLFAAWNYVLIREPLPTIKLTDKEQKVIDAIANTGQWEKLSRNQRYEFRKNYELILDEYLPAQGAVNRKLYVGNLIREKWEELLSGYVCNGIPQSAADDSTKDVCNDLWPDGSRPWKGRLQHSSIVCNRQEFEPNTPAATPPERCCRVTGLKIGNQWTGSIFISEGTIKKNTEIGKRLADRYRTNRRKRQCHSEEYYLAHNIRNEDSNPRNNLRRQLNRVLSQPALFDQTEYIKLTHEQMLMTKYWEGTKWEVVL